MKFQNFIFKLVPFILAISVIATGIMLMQAAAAAEGPSSEIITVNSTNIPKIITVSVHVVPYKRVTFTAQLPGRVKYIAGEEGQLFQSGQVLLAMDESELVAQRNAAYAQLMNTQAALQNSQVQYSHDLYSPSPGSKQVMPGMGMPAMFERFFMAPMGSPVEDRRAGLHNSMTSVTQARSSWAQAQSQIQAIDAKLRNTQSIAPFVGVLIEKHVEVGDTVQPGQALVSFAHTQFLRVEANVPARLLKAIKPGQVFEATIDHQQVRVRVAHIYPNADVTQHTVKVKFDLPVGTPAAMGMYAVVNIPVEPSLHGSDSTVRIPKSALLRGGSLPRVLVINQNKSELRVLRVGGIASSSEVMVLAGLSKGERIINNPPANAKSGWMPN